MVDRVVRVLGPIDVLTTAGPVGVGGHHQRALLGALVIGAGRAVGIELLTEAVWGDEAPATAHATLQSYVSHLRRVVGPLAIVAVDHSYSLCLDHVSIDAIEFERLVQQAEDCIDLPRDRLELCRRALALWRGPPFGDLADDESFRLEAFRLDELRLNLVELWLDAELGCGRPDLVVAELEVAVEEHPYRERLWRLLIEALVQTERRVAALRACHRLRSTLADVGVTPSPWLDEVEQAILRDRD